ncbi:thiamine pyrophosphate-binding protein [Pararhodobacter sp.]|uniref:thiamine pyrophosphate-binding protein n=1 Tax=Pararhodobacter sp. TaxID=2127056 RepID=UPI002FDE226E
MKMHQLLADGLRQLGVGHLFGLIGDANLFLVQAYCTAGAGRYVACNHEANAVLAAIGYAQTTGRTGVATVTHGPGLTNCATALTEAARGGIGLVLLCGDTAPGDAQHLQNTNQRALVEATGAAFVELRGPDMALSDLEQAFRIAALQRRPVVFNMRVDLQWADVTPQKTGFAITRPQSQPAGGEALEEAVAMIASARRPLVLAGRGAMDDAARAALVALATRLEAPLATTLKAQALFHREPFDLGISGNLSHPTAIDTIMKSDCIIAFGASLGKYTTEGGAYLKGKRVIQVLADTHETPWLETPDIRLIGDIAGTARAMAELLDLAEIPGSAATDSALAEGLAAEAAARAAPLPFAQTAPGTVDFIPALRRLNQALPQERVLVADLGRFVFSVWRNLPVTRPQDLVFTAHFGGIGCGTGQAIGAAVAVPDRPTVLVAGDGGFVLSGVGELSVIAREQPDMVIILCNDGSYGAEYIQFANRNLPTDLSMIAPPDFAALGTAAGIASLCVRDEAELDAACRAIRDRKGPLMIDLRLDPAKIEK